MKAVAGGSKMPAKPRSKVFDPDQVGIYHCWNRVVRRRHLFGWDAVTGRDFSYRKNWVRDRFRELAGSMAIEVLDYAILDNHAHIVLRNRPDIVETWSDEEVVRRWWFVCPWRRNEDGSIPDPKPCEIGLLMPRVDEYRRRLSDISWMMRLACQRIAVRANKEDGVDGRFFAKRFDCKRLKTEVDVLSCSLYVDLNWIRAGMADTPEESRFTSAFDRIQARWEGVQREMSTSSADTLPSLADDWLAPVFLDERADAYVGPQSNSHDTGTAPESTFSNPIRSARVSNKGFLPMTADQYLSLLDSVGRVIREGKRGCIPADLSPILRRLGLEPQSWLDSFLDLFRSKPHPPPSPLAILRG
jgi:REP element-mobilizing transposase RayT